MGATAVCSASRILPTTDATVKSARVYSTLDADKQMKAEKYRAKPRRDSIPPWKSARGGKTYFLAATGKTVVVVKT
jgi:hypothetical protein